MNIQHEFQVIQLVDTLGTGFFSETNQWSRGDARDAQILPAFDSMEDAIDFILTQGFVGCVYKFNLRTPEEFEAERKRVETFNNTRRENTLPQRANKRIGMGDKVWVSDPKLVSIGELETKTIKPHHGGSLLIENEKKQIAWIDICEISEDDELILSNIKCKS